MRFLVARYGPTVTGTGRGRGGSADRKVSWLDPLLFRDVKLSTATKAVGTYVTYNAVYLLTCWF